MTEMTSKEMVDLSREYTFFLMVGAVAGQPHPGDKSGGRYFWDADGKRYLDFSSQLMNTNIGHQHSESGQSHTGPGC